MKIDLHIHNKKIFSGESEKRNVTPNRFKTILKESGVTIAAITNHHYFGDDVFVEYEDDRLLLLPGMEININDNGKKSHVNIIMSNNDKDKLNDIYKNNFKDKKEEYKIELKNFIDIFKDHKIILLLDQKRNITNVSKQLATSLNEEMKKAVIIHDVNNARTHRILMANQSNSLIGSDVEEWDRYISQSYKLLSPNFKINTFNILYNILKNKEGLENIIKNLESTNYKIRIDKDKFSIPIYDGLNLIIGDKGTGKSKILEFIESYNQDNSIKTSTYFTDFKKDYYTKIMNSEKIFWENKEIINNIEQWINDIKIMKKDLADKPSSFKSFIEQSTNSNVTIQDIRDKPSSKHDFSDIEKFIRNLKNNNREIKQFLESLDISWEKFSEYEVITKKLRAFAIKKYFRINKEEISNFIFNNIICEVRKVIKIKTGTISSSFKVGLFGQFIWIDNICKIKDKIKNAKLLKEKNILDTYEIPNLKKINLVEKNILIDFNKKLNKDNKGKHIVKEWNENVKPLFVKKKLNEKNINKFIEYWNENITKRIVITKREINNLEGKKIDLSTGQRSLFLLLNKLNEDSDYFLLDEPSVHLGSNAVMKVLNKKISELKKMGKKIIVASHNANLGINALPNFFIYRKIISDSKYDTYTANIASDVFENNDGEQISFNEIVMNMFESGNEEYNFRKGIYDSKGEN